MSMSSPRASWAFEDSTVRSTWREQLPQASRNPRLRERLASEASELLPRFAAHYTKLRALPRRVPRDLQRMVRPAHRALAQGTRPTRMQSLAEVGLLLALRQALAAAVILLVIGTFLPISAVAQECTPPPSGLVSWWPGDGDANDIADGNNGTLENGATFAPGKVAQAFSFDGVNDFATFGNTVGNFGTGDFTIDFWIKTTSSVPTPEVAFYLVSKRSVCSHASFFDISLVSGGRVQMEVDEDSSGTNYFGPTSIAAVNDGNFHSVAFTRQGTVISIYIDGILDRTATAPGIANIVNSTNVTLAKSACTGLFGNPVFAGQMDEVEVFNRALSASEIQAIFNAGSAGKCKGGGTGPQADLSVTKTDSPDPVTGGDDLTYTLTVTNNGPDDATGVTLTDDLPDSVLFASASTGCTELSGVVTCNIGSLTNGGNAIREIVVSTTTDGTITNTASVTGTEADPDTGNNTANEDTVVNVAAVPMADLAVTKADSPDPVTVGSNLSYTITTTNNGPDPATGVTLTDTLPGGVTFVSASTGCTQASGVVSCTIGNLANGANAPIQITVTPNSQGTLSNTAQVSASENDPVSANNNATEQTTVGAVSAVTCAGRTPTITGTASGETLNGTARADIIHGLGGNDLIRGRGGNDIICGGEDIDRLQGGGGNDQLLGEAGNDQLFGQAGADSLDGGADVDRCNGGTPAAGDTATNCESISSVP